MKHHIKVTYLIKLISDPIKSQLIHLLFLAPKQPGSRVALRLEIFFFSPTCPTHSDIATASSSVSAWFLMNAFLKDYYVFTNASQDSWGQITSPMRSLITDTRLHEEGTTGCFATVSKSKPIKRARVTFSREW